MQRKELRLLSLDEAIAEERCTMVIAPSATRSSSTIYRRPPAPSPACLSCRTRAIALPQALRPGPFSIRLDD